MDTINRFMFVGVPIFIMIIFVIVIGNVIVAIVKGISTWSHNNAQPVLNVLAKVVTKRTNVSSSMHHNNSNMHHARHSTSYYVTFEVESGDRMEFNVVPEEFGMLVEGDVGKLTFQGTRYKGFERNR